ncbi:MAG: hypothetical protein ACRCZB_00255 [Bacteroidales bacterium]
MTKKFLLYTFAALMLLSACSSEEVFLAHHFIPDDVDSELPKATQLGYNTAGAFLNTNLDLPRNTWLITPQFATNSTISLQADGMILDFSLRGFILSQTTPILFELTHTTSIKSLFGLQSLSRQEFSTTAGNLFVDEIPGVFATYNNPIVVTKASIKFDDCKRIYIKSEFQGICAPGTFEIEGIAADSIEVQIYKGRFDILFKRYDNNQFYL